MTREIAPTLAVLMLAACTRGGTSDTGPTLDTGWFSDTAPMDTATCEDRVTATDPADGEQGFYWRDPLVLRTGSDVDHATRLSAGGAAIATSSARQGEELVITPTEPLSPSTEHVLAYSDCAGTHELRFTTSAYGEPLEGGPSTLIHGTWNIDLRKASWHAPAGFGAVLSLYFDVPVLIGAQWADDRIVDLIGAQGVYYTSGAIKQDPTASTWEYPAADFSGQPYFAVAADSITLELDSVALTIHDFALTGTFAADGSTIGGARVTGRGDTRNLGPALDLGDDPNAVCELAASMGAACEPCPDAQVYCLYLDAREIEGEQLPDVVIEPR